MILLFVFVLFTSADRDPYAAAIRAPSLAACQEKAEATKVKAAADPDVKGFIIECRAVPDKA